jgi:UTP--glucose-1-phosphate uridylyltransferase
VTSRPARQLIDAARELGTAVIGLEEVPLEKVGRYGIVGGAVLRDGILKLDTLVEKPSKESAPSRYAIAARYVLTPTDLGVPRADDARCGCEIQLTDALKLLLCARADPRRRAQGASARHRQPGRLAQDQPRVRIARRGGVGATRPAAPVAPA